MPGKLNDQFHTAIRIGELDIARDLIRRGAEVNYCNPEGNSALHVAVQHANGHLDVINFLLKNGISINSRNSEGCSPIFIAVKKCDLAVVQELIKCGAEVDLCCSSGDTPLYLSIQNRDLDIIREIAKKTKHLNFSPCIFHQHPIPLHSAVDTGDVKTIRVLIDAGAEVKFIMGKDTLRYAVQQRLSYDNYKRCGLIEYPLDVLKELILNGSKINEKNLLSQTPFSLAVKKYKVDPMCTRTLIKYTVLKFHLDYETMINLDTCKKNSYDAVTKYIRECAHEIAQMKSYVLNSRFSLFDVASKGIQPDNISLCFYPDGSEDIVNQMLNSFPIYYDVISAVIIRTDLVSKLIVSRIYAVSNEHKFHSKRVFLNEDCLYILFKYLPNCDLMNLAKIFCNLHNHSSDSLKSLNISPICAKRPYEGFSDNCLKSARLE